MARANAMIALKLPEGMCFGRVRKVSISRVLFELENPLRLGQQLEWRMELPNWNATVFGELQIRRMKEREDRPDVYEARIVHINRENTERLQNWLADLSVGGNTRRYESDHSVINGLKTSRMSGASHTETASVLARMDRRANPNKRDLAAEADAFGLASQISSVVSGIEEGMSGRQAMSNALKASLKAGGQRRRRRSSDSGTGDSANPTARSRWESAPVTHAPPEDSAVSSLGRPDRSRSPAWLQDRSDVRPRRMEHVASPNASSPRPSDRLPEREKTVQSRNDSSSQTSPRVEILGSESKSPLRVTYLNHQSFQDAWTQHLQRSGLFLQEANLGPVGTERPLELVLPSGLSVKCSAQIVAPMPTGTGLALRLQPSQLRTLKREAH